MGARHRDSSGVPGRDGNEYSKTMRVKGLRYSIVALAALGSLAVGCSSTPSRPSSPHAQAPVYDCVPNGAGYPPCGGYPPGYYYPAYYGGYPYGYVYPGVFLVPTPVVTPPVLTARPPNNPKPSPRKPPSRPKRPAAKVCHRVNGETVCSPP